MRLGHIYNHRKLIICLLLLTILSVNIKCTCDTIADTLNEEVTKLFEVFPNNSETIKNNLQTSSNYFHGVVGENEVETSLKANDVNPEVISKFQAIAFAKSLFFQSFAFVIVNDRSILEEYVGTAKHLEKDNKVEYAVIKINIQGSVVQEFKRVVNKDCTRIAFFKDCDIDVVNLPAGYSKDYLNSIIGTLKAAGYQELVKQINIQFTRSKMDVGYLNVLNKFQQEIRDVDSKNGNYCYTYYLYQNYTVSGNIHYDKFETSQMNEIFTKKHILDASNIQLLKENLNKQAVSNFIQNSNTGKLFIGYMTTIGNGDKYEIFYLEAEVKGIIIQKMGAIPQKVCTKARNGQTVCTNKFVKAPVDMDSRDWEQIRKTEIFLTSRYNSQILNNFENLVYDRYVRQENCGNQNLLFLQ